MVAILKMPYGENEEIGYRKCLMIPTLPLMPM